jgi:hypothetical protein
MSVTVTVTEIADNDIIITADQVIVTTHEGTALFNADEITISSIEGLSASTIQEALHELADQKFVQADAPSPTDPNLEQGDLWYNTLNDKLMVYRNTNWEELILASQLSEGSVETEYQDVSLHGGTF